MALNLGRRMCGLQLVQVAKEAEMTNDGVVATKVRRYELRLERDRAEKSRGARVVKLFNGDPLAIQQHGLNYKDSSEPGTN